MAEAGLRCRCGLSPVAASADSSLVAVHALLVASLVAERGL